MPAQTKRQSRILLPQRLPSSRHAAVLWLQLLGLVLCNPPMSMLTRVVAFSPVPRISSRHLRLERLAIGTHTTTTQREWALFSSSAKQKQQQQKHFDGSDATSASGYARPVVQWYPGHIAKAERQLKETFKAVDVVIEVRDARIAKATSHPMVGAWCAGRPRLVVLTHVDQIPAGSLKAWKQAFETLGAEHPDQAHVLDGQILNQARQAARERAKYAVPKIASRRHKNKKNNHKQLSSSTTTPTTHVAPVQDVLFVNAKLGAGVPALTRAIFRAGAHVQERRLRRGLKERPLRVGK